jgi:hypothetical protein
MAGLQIDTPTEIITFRVTPEEKGELTRIARRLRKHANYTLSDLCRVALLRFQRSARNGGRKWLLEQISTTPLRQAQQDAAVPQVNSCQEEVALEEAGA